MRSFRTSKIYSLRFAVISPLLAIHMHPSSRVEVVERREPICMQNLSFLFKLCTSIVREVTLLLWQICHMLRIEDI
jgi:hypothetical protein